MNPNYQHFRLDESVLDRVTIWIDVHERSVNVLSEPVFDELLQIIEAETQRARNLPLIFRSAKRQGFIVGADLRRILSIETDAQIQQFLLQGQTVFDRLEHFQGTSVALIQGPCLGGGLEFALACSFRVAVAASSTQLGMPEAKLGLMPGWGGTQRLIDSVGLADGMAMLLTGQAVDAQRACELHLVDGLIEESKLEDELTRFLCRLSDPQTSAAVTENRLPSRDKVAANLALAQLDLARFGELSLAQAAIYQAVSLGITQSTDSGLRAERELFYPLLMSAEAQENLQRFANRSKPSG